MMIHEGVGNGTIGMWYNAGWELECNTRLTRTHAHTHTHTHLDEQQKCSYASKHARTNMYTYTHTHTHTHKHAHTHTHSHKHIHTHICIDPVYRTRPWIHLMWLIDFEDEAEYIFLDRQWIELLTALVSEYGYQLGRVAFLFIEQAIITQIVSVYVHVYTCECVCMCLCVCVVCVCVCVCGEWMCVSVCVCVCVCLCVYLRVCVITLIFYKKPIYKKLALWMSKFWKTVGLHCSDSRKLSCWNWKNFWFHTNVENRYLYLLLS